MKSSTRFSRIKKKSLDFLFPPVCAGCGKYGSFLCAKCRESLKYISSPLCSNCGRPLASGSYCSGCVRWPMKIDGIRSVLEFDGVVQKLIYDFKYHYVRVLTPLLAQFLADYLKINELPVDILVPVPLHSHRLRERGYNQSTLLAYELSCLAETPFIEGVLTRIIDTTPQARTANIRERRENMTGVFICQDNSFKGKQVLLIDDVCTTGATINACAIALKKTGAASVWGLTVAREL